ncbi:endonuclease domain-containing protein [Pseudomonas sp. EA_15y_Pfl2_R67]|uniref:endonuclease domain-containing protein n=1 Tax=Pseudomonas sp. EA_15y_Pfl2_R67 TaxID=3088687 RepID=UPI0030D716B3
MKYPGHPTTPPSWYRDKGSSPIESSFSEAAQDLAEKIEQEHWFGDSEKHHRYRVDFLLKDARLIIELDGHDFHSSKEQLAKDAERQRYLVRAGYVVIRFTGREIYQDVAGCVAQVTQTYTEMMQRAPAMYRVMYVDYAFLRKQIRGAVRFYRVIHPKKSLSAPSFEQLIPQAIEWLHEKSFITVYVFAPPRLDEFVQPLSSTVLDYEKGEVRFTTLVSEQYSLDLGDHMRSYAHLFDQFILIADDPVYVEPLRSVLPQQLSERTVGSITHQFLGNAKLLRLGNDETSLIPNDLNRVLWQNVWYAIGSAMGLEMYEL